MTTTTDRYTPGPYWRSKTAGGIFIKADGPNGDVEIATVHREAEYDGNLPLEANSALFLAAPLLAAAMREVLVHYTDTEGASLPADVAERAFHALDRIDR